MSFASCPLVSAGSCFTTPAASSPAGYALLRAGATGSDGDADTRRRRHVCSISSAGVRHHFRMTLRTALKTAFACGSVAPPSSSAAVRTWALAGPSRRVANASRKRSFTAGCACECGRESHVTDSRAARARARKCQHRDSGRTFEEQLSSSSNARLSVSEICTVAIKDDVEKKRNCRAFMGRRGPCREAS